MHKTRTIKVYADTLRTVVMGNSPLHLMLLVPLNYPNHRQSMEQGEMIAPTYCSKMLVVPLTTLSTSHNMMLMEMA